MHLHERLRVEKERFEHDPELQQEFSGGWPIYEAFLRAEHTGSFKIFQNAKGLTKHTIDMAKLDQDFGGTEVHLSQARCTGLTMLGRIERLSGSTGSDFQVMAYTGKPVKRWWGQLAINVTGIKAKNAMPILRDHDANRIVGFSTKAWRDGSFFVAGKFSTTTQAGQEARALVAEGFSWQASIGVSPLKVLSVDKDSSHEVNGMKVKGPAEVWLESKVYEVSFVPLGADSDTSISMLNFQERN